jgi:hypothetical protein
LRALVPPSAGALNFLVRSARLPSAAFPQGKIRIARGITDRAALVHELKNYSRTTNIATGNMAFEPWRESDHDDLLFAVCLALWGWQTRKGQTTLRVIR